MQRVRMDRSNTYIKVSDGGLGVLPVGLRSSCGRPTYGIPWPDHGGFGKAHKPLGDRAHHTFARSEGPADRSRKRTFTPAATCQKAGTALKLAGKLGRAEDLEEALQPS